LLNLTYEMGPAGVRVIDRGTIHQDHAVVVRGIAAGLNGPSRSFAFYCDGQTLGAEEAPQAPPPLSPVGTARLPQPEPRALDGAALSPEEIRAKVQAIRDVPLCLRSEEDARWLEEVFDQHARAVAQLDPLAREMMRGGGWFPSDEGRRPPDLARDIEEVTKQYRRLR
jgi:hypothetical protein